MQVRNPAAAAAGARRVAAEPKAAARIPTLVVTCDDTLWGPIAALPSAVDARQFDSITEFLTQWPSRRPAVVIIDARGEANFAGLLQRVLTHGAALVPVAVVDEPLRVPAAMLERQRVLFDHLLLPLDLGTARTILDRASEEAAARLALTAGETGLPAATPAPAPVAEAEAKPMISRVPEAMQDAVPVASSDSAAPERPWVLYGGFGAVALVLVAIGIWWWLRPVATVTTHLAPPPAASAARPGAAAPATAASAVHGVSVEEVEAKLERARLAMRDRRYIDPADDNALTHYKSALVLDPTNGEAQQGLSRITELLLTRAAASLAGHDAAAALRSLEAARSLEPGNPRLAALDAQVSARASELSATQVQAALQANAFTRATSLLAQAEKAGTIPAAEIAQLRQELARRSAASQITDLERLIQARISQGQLIEPAGDSARAYLAALREKAGPAQAEEVAKLTDLYQKRIVAEVRVALAAGAASQADAWIAELKATPGGAAQAAALQKDADKARAPRVAAPSAEPATVAVPDAAKVAAATGSAPTAGATAAVGVATPAHLTKPLQVVYPRQAAAMDTSGVVEVEFDVPPSGHPENLRVLDASPPGVFDAAAIDAVKRATFVPAIAADGSKQRSTVLIRVRFKLNDKP